MRIEEEDQKKAASRRSRLSAQGLAAPGEWTTSGFDRKSTGPNKDLLGGYSFKDSGRSLVAKPLLSKSRNTSPAVSSKEP
jgi:hypothetical protein